MGNGLVWVDICSGLGGASQPAKDRGWTVYRVDIDSRFKPDVVADARSLPLRRFHVDVLWASTPCTEYSKHGLRCFYKEPPLPDISLEVGVLRAIEWLKPDMWVVENVRAARPWLTKLFGPVRAQPLGHALWSNQLLMLPFTPPHKGSFNHSQASGQRWGPASHNRKYDSTEWYRKRGKSRVGTGHNGMEASLAAQIPYEIGEAICIAVERRHGAISADARIRHDVSGPGA